MSERTETRMNSGTVPGGDAGLNPGPTGLSSTDSQGAPDPFVAMSAALTPKRAVSYIRVSTREQAQRGGAEEGFSLPAQREANKKKAASMGALVVKEFADRGESARSANRPELQKMLTYLKQDGEIDYVIVHKLDRLARNRADDVEINKAFEEAGVRLVSTSENIDQTPGGILLHGIMSSIAEFYSRNLANEVIKGMGEKARNGGTLGKAPLGYRNVRGRDAQGREIRTVELDEQRAPLMRLAFSQYATGNWTVAQLAEHLAGLGLDLPAAPSKPAKPITKNRLHTLLRHPYYRGVVQFQGVEYPGQHPALVDAETWYQVQAVLDSHRNGERQRLHNHFLKSTVVCGQCGARLLVQNAKNHSGVVYPYFVCARRHRLHDCTFRAVLIEQVEARMSDVYRQIHLSHQDREVIERYLLEELERIEATSQHDIRSLTIRRTQIEDQRRQLLQAHYSGAIPLDLLKDEQERLSRELLSIQRQLNGYQADTTAVRQHLSQALDLLEDCHRLYQAAPDHLKKQLNQVFFQRVLVNPLVDEHGRVIREGEPKSGPMSDEKVESEESNEESVSSVAPVIVRDHTSTTSAAASLNFPFDQLTSSRLQWTARHSQPGPQSSLKSDGGDIHQPDPDNHTDVLAPQRKAPTLTGERFSLAATAPGPSPLGAGSYRGVVVPPAGLEPARLAASAFKAAVSTDSTTGARHGLGQQGPGAVPPPGFEPGTLCLSGTDEV